MRGRRRTRHSAVKGLMTPPRPPRVKDDIVRIRATAVLADGARFVRNAIVRLATQVNAGEPTWQVLDWD